MTSHWNPSAKSSPELPSKKSSTSTVVPGRGGDSGAKSRIGLTYDASYLPATHAIKPSPIWPIRQAHRTMSQLCQATKCCNLRGSSTLNTIWTFVDICMMSSKYYGRNYPCFRSIDGESTGSRSRFAKIAKNSNVCSGVQRLTTLRKAAPMFASS